MDQEEPLTLAEKVDALDSRVAGVDTKLTELGASVDARFDSVDKRFDAVDKRFDSVDKRFDAVDERFDAVDERFDAVDKRFSRRRGTRHTRFGNRQRFDEVRALRRAARVWTSRTDPERGRSVKGDLGTKIDAVKGGSNRRWTRSKPGWRPP
jgi:hypothetical protein